MPGFNQMCSYDVVVFVSMLVLVSGQCTKNYSGFKQCTNLNGATHKTCPDSGGCGMCSSPSYFREKFGCNLGNCLHTACLTFETDHSITTVFVEDKNINNLCSTDKITEANYLAALETKFIHNSTTCKTVFYAYQCPQTAILIGEDPCDASGAPMRICYDLCTAFQACLTVTTSFASAGLLI